MRVEKENYRELLSKAFAFKDIMSEASEKYEDFHKAWEKAFSKAFFDEEANAETQFSFEKMTENGRETKTYYGGLPLKEFVHVAELAGFVLESETREGDDIYLTFRISAVK